MLQDVKQLTDQERRSEQALASAAVGRPVLKRLVEGEIDLDRKASSGGGLVLSGYVSTASPDLTNEIVEPKSFDAYLYRYKNNPVYCFNHDQFMPIGKVVPDSIVRDERGLNLGRIELADVPIVRDYLAPLILEGVLKQQSIAFLSLKGHVDTKGVYHHDLVYLIECSIVTVACNPDASADVVKRIKRLPGFEDVETIDDLVRLYQLNRLPSLDDVKDKFVSLWTPAEARAAHDAAPVVKEKEKDMELNHSQDFATVVATCWKAGEGIGLSPDADAAPLPSRIHKDYDRICEHCYAAKRAAQDRTAYMFPVATPTADGCFKYVWELAAVSMMRVMGAKNDAVYEPGAKAAVVERVAQAYDALGKDAPSYKGVPLHKLTPEALTEVEFKDVEWKSEERIVFDRVQIENDFRNINNSLKAYVASPDGVPAAIKSAVFKGVYAWFELWASVNDQRDADLINQIMQVLIAQDDETDDGGAYAMQAAPSGDSKADDAVRPAVEGLVSLIREMRDLSAE